MGTKLSFKTKKAFIEFIKNKSDFTIEIINETDDWIIFRCEAKINKPRCGTGGTGGSRMTLNKLAEIVLNLSNTVETGFANVNKRLDKVESRLDNLERDVADIKVRVGNLEKDVSVLKQDVADIKRCPTIQKELSEIA